MEYAFTKKLSQPFAEALVSVKKALSEEGFGILTETDIAATLKKKLGVTYDKYVILGACNPPLAHRSLQAEKLIGLFLPCNVILYEEDDAVHVAAIRPTAAMSMIQNAELADISAEAEKKLSAVVESLV